MIKCPQCGEENKFIEFKDHKECYICGFIISAEKDEYSNKETETIKVLNSYLKSLKDVLSKERYDREYVASLVKDILSIDEDNVIASCIKAYLNKEYYPEDFKNYILSLGKLNLDKDVLDFLLRFIINNSEYKFFDSITTTLNNLKLFQEYNDLLYNAKIKLDQQDDDFADYPRDVFVCYSSNDLEYVKQLVDTIEKAGYKAWYSDRNMPKNSLSKTNYKKTIEDAISKCKVFLMIMSLNSRSSKDVKWEMKVANEQNIKNRIQYCIEKVENNHETKTFFDGIQWIDASTSPQETLLLGRIYSLLNNEEIKQKDEFINEFDYSFQIDDHNDEEVEDEDVEDEVVEAEENVDAAQTTFEDEDEIDEDEIDVDEEDEEENESNLCLVNGQPFDVDLPTWNTILKLFNSENYEDAMSLLSLFPSLPKVKNPLYLYSVSYCLRKGIGVDLNYLLGIEFLSYLGEYQVTESSTEEYALALYRLGVEAYKEQRNVSKLPEGSKVDESYYDLFENKALVYLTVSANNGNIDALAYIGLCYKNGISTNKDEKLAIKYIQESALKNSAFGAYQLGILYESKDYFNSLETAFDWFNKAYEYGYSKALIKLGYCYYYGKGTKLSHDKAFKCYKKAASLNIPEAYYNLGNCYIKGRGVDQNISQGKKYLEKALDSGVKEAKLYLESL